MSITTHQRPGVYSAYEVSSLVRGSDRGGMVALAAVNTQMETGTLVTLTSYEQAAALFGAAGAVTKLVTLALRNGAAGVICAVAAQSADYPAVFELLCRQENVSVMICNSVDAAVQQALRDCVLEASAARKERIAVVAGARGESISELVERAAALNSERVVLVGPGALDDDGDALSGVKVAAAVAGVIAGQRDPAVPLGGAVLKGIPGVSSIYSDGDLDMLILGGVTPVEEVGGEVSVVRGVTTRTATDGVSDATWRDLSSILVIDTVIPSLRTVLRNKFRRAKNTPRGRGAIRAQVVVELEKFLEQEIITDYDNVSVTADENDPTRALVEFAFTAAHGLNQIWLSAHITV